MQITSGSVRGFTLKVPKGEKVRPSQNQVRLAIFSILESNYLQNTGYQTLRCLDLFAGTGALGLEALSRGVAYVDFVEKDKRHALILQENIAKTRFDNKSAVFTTNANTYVQRDFPALYDIVFLDPPYAMADTINLQEIVDVLGKNGVLVYLHDAHYMPQPQIRTHTGDCWSRNEPRTYGTTGVSFYILNPAE